MPGLQEGGPQPPTRPSIQGRNSGRNCPPPPSQSPHLSWMAGSIQNRGSDLSKVGHRGTLPVEATSTSVLRATCVYDSHRSPASLPCGDTSGPPREDITLASHLHLLGNADSREVASLLHFRSKVMRTQAIVNVRAHTLPTALPGLGKRNDLGYYQMHRKNLFSAT